MEILQLSHRLPYPPIDGGKIHSYRLVKHFHSAGHPVHLVCIAPQEERSIDLGVLRENTRSLAVFYKDVRNKRIGLANNTFFSTLAYTTAKYIFPDVENHILEHLSGTRTDIVLVDHLHMAHYAIAIKKRFPKILIVIRQHNIEHTILQRFYLMHRNPITRQVLKLQFHRLKGYEKDILSIFDAILVMTPEDAYRVRSLDPSMALKTYVVPAGVGPERMKDLSGFNRNGILHMAAMDWLPNQEGLKWFVKEVFPIILQRRPSVNLFIVGKNTPESFRKFESKNIKFIGFVENPDTIMRESQLGVVPLFVGGGMRIKILNYLAAGIPVVSTTIGAEGIDVKDGEDILLADTPSRFAECVITIFTQENLQRKLSRNGIDLIKKKYSWDSVVRRMEKVFDTLIQARK